MQTSIIAYRQDIVRELQLPENRRILYFYYCDNREGISVRLYDPTFAGASVPLPVTGEDLSRTMSLRF
jgi:hypothetical protein